MVQERKRDLTVFIGRFSPFHQGHAFVLEQALKNSQAVVVLIGSSGQARTIKNPFTFEERKATITRWAMGVNHEAALRILPINDHPYNDQMWIREVVDSVEQAAADITSIPHNPEIYLTGCNKDTSSWYLQCFPQWLHGLVEPMIDHGKVLSATNIRTAMFANGPDSFMNSYELHTLPVATQKFLSEFTDTIEYAQLRREYDFIRTYKESWDAAPYAPTFVTTDAVVVQSGHVLLIERRAEPGRGLWALPGGFLNQQERLLDGCIRELREETKLKIPEPVLRGSVVSKEIFDHPDRSLRGRTITTAFLIQLPSNGALPKVKGSDDAAKAEWVPINTALKMSYNFFEDHHAILSTMLGRIAD